jgi:hypothetical protein
MRQMLPPAAFVGLVLSFLFAVPLLTAPAASAQTPGVTIDKQAETVSNRSFDPAKPPADMPPPTPEEEAECDSNFLSNAAVAGQAQQTDATHATVTITQVKVTLQLEIIIWLPNKVTQHVTEHENGHRQISEVFYQTADNVADRIAAPYMGKQVVITGTDLRGQMSKLLEQMSTDITDEYNKEITPEPTQLRFDAITDHGRNDVAAADAMAQALKQIPPSLAPPPATTNPALKL